MADFTIKVSPKRGGSSYYTYKVEAVENSTDVANNSSNVTLTLYIKHSSWNPAYEGYSTHCGISVDGVPITSGTVKKTVGTSYVQMLTWTGDIQHNSDGGKDAVISVWLYHSSSADYLPEDSKADSPLTIGTWTLTDIPRASEFYFDTNVFELGVRQTIVIQNASTGFRQVMKYSCGNITGTIADGTNVTTAYFTPSLDLARQNTIGTTVNIKYTLLTYSGDTLIGEFSYIVANDIPASVIPSVQMNISDGMGYATTYGGYLKGLSTLEIELTPTLAYGAEIVSYSITANGATYPTQAATTDVLKRAGTQTVTAAVVDSRGRAGTADLSITVLEYTSPTIKAFRAFRCDSNGNENGKGAYIKILFDAVVTALSNKNTASYILSYKKASDPEYTDVALSDYAGNFNVSGGSYVFAADTGSPYDVRLSVADNFHPISKTTAVSAGSVYVSRYKDKVFSIGETADINDDEVFNVAFKTRLKGGILPITLDYGTDLNDVTLSGFYSGLSTTANTENVYVNSPFTSVPFALFVADAGMNSKIQIAFSSSGAGGAKWRRRSNAIWLDWTDFGGSGGASGDFLPLSGGTMEGNINLGTNRWIEGTTTSGGVFSILGLIDPTRFQVGGSYPSLELKGKDERPTYNGGEMALMSDIETMLTEIDNALAGI